MKTDDLQNPEANGDIMEYMEVCNIFEMHETTAIGQEIMKLSEVLLEEVKEFRY